MGESPDPVRRSRRRRRLLWVGVAAAVAAVAGYVGVPWVYINWIKDPAPPPLSLDSLDSLGSLDSPDGPTTSPPTGATGAPAPGDAANRTWKVVAPSVAGYRVREVLNGQRTEAAGRTEAVEGTVSTEGTTVTAAEISVDLESITSDSDRRDAQFRGRIMNTAEFPVATFVLDGPVALAALPGATPTATAVTGTLSLRGVERPVTIQVTARAEGTDVLVQGSVEIVFADFGIEDPSLGPVRTEDRGLMEFALRLAPAGS
jgi:polyisoprenoid-binding protein YceI